MVTDDFPYLPGMPAEIQDGGLRISQQASGRRVTVIACTNNSNLNVGETYEITNGRDLDDLLNTDGSVSDAYKAALEARAGGARQLDVHILDNSVSGATGLTPTGLYGKLDDAYELLIDHDTDYVVPYGAYMDATGLATNQSFAYQLANHCFRATINENSRRGVIAVTGPANAAGPTGVPTLAEMKAWKTALESYDTSGINGTDFSEYDGVTDTDGDGMPENYRFWATSDESMPAGPNAHTAGTVLKDRKKNPIDIGAYISTVAIYGRMTNQAGTALQPTLDYYQDTAGPAAAYAGLLTSKPTYRSALNRPLSGVAVTRNWSRSQANALSKQRFVTARIGNGGSFRITDAMTGAYNVSSAYRSDFVRLTTVEIIHEVIEAVRDVVDPFLGGPNLAIHRAAMDKAVDDALNGYVGTRLEDFRASVTSTPAQRVLGQVYIDLELQVALEIRKIFIRVAATL